MKKISPLLSIIIISIAGTAQPTLQQDNGFQSGSIIQIYIDVNPTLDEGNAGNNQTWDFSSLSSISGSTEFDGVLASSTPFAADFPNAQFASSSFDYSGTMIYNYFTNDNSQYSTWGYESDQEKLIYTNPRDILHYPFAYGDTFIDTYYGTIPLGYNSGTVEEKADGIGKLVLPTGTFYNCIRVREVRIDTLDGNLIMTTSNDTSYKFYVVSRPEPLCQVNYHHSSGGFDLKEIYWQDVQPNYVQQVNSYQELSLFPNPCNDILNLSIPFVESDAVITIEDALGKVVKTESIFQNQSLVFNTAMLPAGVYFLSIRTKEGLKTASFVKQVE